MLLFSSTNHHAKLVVSSDRDKITELILKDYVNSPATIIYNQNVIDIDTVRALSSWHIKEMNGSFLIHCFLKGQTDILEILW